MRLKPKTGGLSLLLLATATSSWAAPAGLGAAHPVVDVESGFVIGGSAGGRWLKPAQAARSLKGGESYRVYGTRGSLGSAKASKPASQGAPCDQTLFLDLKPSRKAGEFALQAPWNALPRAPRTMSTTQPAYINAVASLLRQYGIARPIVRISQVWRVDLEGDGEPEVLVSATNHQNRPLDFKNVSPNARAGDYSVVLMRKVVGGKARTIVLDAEIYPKAKTFNAPNVSRLSGVLDVNGDGKMEVLIRSRYYEGNSTEVFEVRGAKASVVLAEGCGA